ncbi:hypothetical protein [Bhargavaea beijingensis]|uniref:hypothetical protein n=1 Tax=Bhargavaea beijingensis TaxID=426756 RepID=UPI002224D65D|nr:hypothetical protein [Bhargavaea beijingensis]MCW1928370.1 hypothetical protein [Bhargavaea beijingensis]
MAVLGILFGLLVIAAIAGQYLLYKNKGKTSTLIFVFNGLLGILLSWLIFTSLPANYDGQRLLSLVWGIIALIGLGMKFFSRKNEQISKLLLTISVIGGIIHLMLG